MAGHSKWKNIQHRKGAQDAKRGKVFAKIAREIVVAVKLGGDDADSNARLRLVLSKARAANMPKDNITRAVNKGAGNTGSESYSEKTYEAVGQSGAAFLIDCLTDNANRTVSEVRYVLGKHGATLGGSVGWMFKQTGVLVYDRASIGGDYDKFMDTVLEQDVDDVREYEEQDDDEGSKHYVEIHCQPQQLAEVKTSLNAFTDFEHEAIASLPDSWVAVDEAQKATILKMLEQLDDLVDVQEVYHNVKL